MSDPLHIPDILDGGWRDLTFEPFREGVEICTLSSGEPTVAVLRYAPGASVPPHRHAGFESILVLDGAQSDERGHYPKGSLILNPENTVHSVWSDTGCVVLIQWQRPVEILG